MAGGGVWGVSQSGPPGSFGLAGIVVSYHGRSNEIECLTLEPFAR